MLKYVSDPLKLSTISEKKAIKNKTKPIETLNSFIKYQS